MKRILVLSIFLVILLSSFVFSESMFKDRINVKIKNCTGCSYDGKCVEIGAMVNPNMYCMGNYTWAKKSFMNLSNGRNAEIKITPDTASATAIERLGELGFNITLKEVGRGNETKAIYYIVTEKETKILGIIKAKAKIEVEVDAENDGKIISIKKPWWSFMATGM